MMTFRDGQRENVNMISYNSHVSDTSSLDSLPMDHLSSKEKKEFDSLYAEPLSPPKIKRIAQVEDSPTFCDSTVDRTTDGIENGPFGKMKSDKRSCASACDTTASKSTTLRSEGSPSISKMSASHKKEKGRGKKKSNDDDWKNTGGLANQIMQLKLAVPKLLEAMKFTQSSRKSDVDLSDLSNISISLVPRNGGGMTRGRMPFERIRTSLMLHLMQRNSNVSRDIMASRESEGGKVKSKSEIFSMLNIRLQNCIAENDGSFTEKSQELVKLVKVARDSLEELKDESGDYLASKKDIVNRNVMCLKFLSAMYREVVKTYELNNTNKNGAGSQDGLSLLVVAGAYYALGKFDQAIMVYQKAGILLKKKISKSPEYMVHCVKLFNNMGCVYFEMKKYEKSMQTFQRALQLLHEEDKNNYSHWVVAIMDQATILNNMAYCLLKFKQYEDAAGLIDSSFELQKMLPGQENPAMVFSTLSTMAYIYYRTKQYHQSLDIYTACFHLQTKSRLHNDCDKVEILQKMDEVCKKIDFHERRVHLLRTILLHQQKFLPEDDDDVWETNAALAQALQAFADSGGRSI